MILAIKLWELKWIPMNTTEEQIYCFRVVLNFSSKALLDILIQSVINCYIAVYVLFVLAVMIITKFILYLLNAFYMEYSYFILINHLPKNLSHKWANFAASCQLIPPEGNEEGSNLLWLLKGLESCWLCLSICQPSPHAWRCITLLLLLL